MSLRRVGHMHAVCWGHCDFKPKQVHVKLGKAGSLDQYKLVDAGSRTPFSSILCASSHLYTIIDLQTAVALFSSDNCVRTH